MSLKGKKIAILIESDFYEKEIFYYEHRFAEEGIEVHWLSRLWGQPGLTFIEAVQLVEAQFRRDGLNRPQGQRSGAQAQL